MKIKEIVELTNRRIDENILSSIPYRLFDHIVFDSSQADVKYIVSW
jgi:hypothetical protein